MKIPYLILGILFLAACTSDELEEPMVADCDGISTPTYVDDIKPIIDESCAYAGCHLGTAPGNYSTYNGLLSVLNSGTFEQRVITLSEDPIIGMPPDNAPAGRPQDLNEDQLLLIRCWLEAGFPEQ